MLKVISPEGVRASLLAIEKRETHKDGHQQALARQLQQAEYEADRAFSQFDQADPKNRLVVETLEQRWNEKLALAEQLSHQQSEVELTQKTLTGEGRKTILQLGKNFTALWSTCAVKHKKKIIRFLIKEIIVDEDREAHKINLILHWQGGSHTTFSVHRPMQVTVTRKTKEEDVELIRKLAVRYNDSEVAQVLSKLGRKTAQGKRWTKSRVGTVRRGLKIKAVRKDLQVGIFNMVQAGEYCGVSDSTLKKLIEAGILPANQIVEFAPYEIKQDDLDREPVSSILKNLKKTGKLDLKGSQSTNQKEFFL